uniref:ZP domain-containing protein n=1 Tax=Oryzias melastigma TaxID=30732 RepID=A0A3B3CYR6_ORYME
FLLFFLYVSIFSDATFYFQIVNNTQVNTSDCPITYYGQEYTTVYTNFTGEDLFVCFNGYYNPEGNGDCIRVPNTDNRTYVDLNNDNDPSSWTGLTDLVHSSVSTVTNNVTCYLIFSFKSVSVLVQSSSFFIQTKQLSDQTLFCILRSILHDICSTFTEHGFGVKPGDTRQIPNTCTFLTCSRTSITSMKTCGPPGQCDGYRACSVKGLCTVTGPTVIDFSEQINSVSDRCEYSLLHDQSTGFSLKANFLDRRRRDVSFVDSLTLDFSDSGDIQLLQGHRVKVTGSPVTLTSSVQTFSGVDLSKDQTGVTASFSVNGSSVSVFFDGTTAQIYLNKSNSLTYEGLCVDSSSSSSSRLPSNSSCQDQYEDPADDTIDCAAVTQQCSILKSAPFSSCNLYVDPEPYIIACRSTLCKYPSVDNLRCQFLKAYAKACEKKQVDLQNWWTTAQYHPEPICEDKCSDHEFCGDIHGNTDCRCRAIFASKFTEQNRLGGPTVCQDNTASLSLVGCLLKEKSIDYTHLHLNDQTCTGVMDPDSHMLKFTFQSDSCGTEVTTNNSQVTFTNAVMTRNSSSDVITRHDKVFIEFSCSHPKPQLQNVAFKIIDNSVEVFLQSGEWKYTLTMKAYSDAAHTQLLDPKSDVRLNQKIWIDLETNGLNKDVVSVVTDSCWATSENSPNSVPRYDLIRDGCPNADDGTVNVMGNGEGTSNSFSFNMFEFSGKETSEVYLHCQLQLCVKKNNNCVPGCSFAGRRRRSLRYRRGAPALISMVWTH